MSSRAEAEKQKQIQDKCQAILGNLLREEDNKYCVDCDAKGPRWAAWNLGIFLCIRCAGIHRNLGVHISKVKSVNLDTWTPEQVACLQQMGNSQARAVYEANLPDSFRRPQTDSSLEAFIRSKYEHKKYIAKEWVPPPPPKPAFDIEEEKKKHKERRSRAKAAGGVEIPVLSQLPAALPRPHSTTPLVQSSKPVNQEIHETTQKPSTNTADLLNLGDITGQQQSEDIFDAFLSAPDVSSAVATTSSPATSAINTEASSCSSNKPYDTTDLFTEMVVTNASSNSKMTKESILSLYGPSQAQQSPHHPATYGLPAGGIYMGQPAYTPATQIPRYSAVPVSNLPANIPGVITHIPGVQQIHHQMANLQLQNPAWNMATGMNVTHLPSAGIVVGADKPPSSLVWPSTAHGQTLSTNLWQ